MPSASPNVITNSRSSGGISILVALVGICPGINEEEGGVDEPEEVEEAEEKEEVVGATVDGVDEKEAEECVDDREGMVLDNSGGGTSCKVEDEGEMDFDDGEEANRDNADEPAAAAAEEDEEEEELGTENEAMEEPAVR